MEPTSITIRFYEELNDFLPPHQLDQDRISVYPRFEAFDISSVRRLPERPLRQPKFIVDENVAKLVQFMRMLGFDTFYQKGITDAAIARISAQEQRIILTRDKGILKRREVTHGLYIRSTKPSEQVREVVDRLQLQSLCQPLTRCLLCNQLLIDLPKDAVLLRQQI